MLPVLQYVANVLAYLLQVASTDHFLQLMLVLLPLVEQEALCFFVHFLLSTLSCFAPTQNMQHLNFHIFFEVLQPLEPTDRARFVRHQRLLEVSSVVVRVLFFGELLDHYFQTIHHNLILGCCIFPLALYTILKIHKMWL